MALSPMKLGWALALALPLISTWTTRATAQACCTATGSNELAVVGRCYEATVAGQLSYETAWGSYDADGEHHGLSQTQVHDVVFTLGAGTRLGWKRLQIYGTAPWRLQHRALGSADGATAFRPGDAAMAVRLTAVDDLMAGVDVADLRTLLPFVDLYAGVGMPLGIAPEDSAVDSAADVTSDGAWKLNGGVKLAKFITLSHVIALRSSYNHRFARNVELAAGTPPREVNLGDDISNNLSFLYLHDLWWSGGALADVRFTLPAQEDGETVANSSARRFRLGAWASYYLTYPSWQLTASLTSDLPLDELGKNIPFAGPTASLTIQRNIPF